MVMAEKGRSGWPPSARGAAPRPQPRARAACAGTSRDAPRRRGRPGPPRSRGRRRGRGPRRGSSAAAPGRLSRSPGPSARRRAHVDQRRLGQPPGGSPPRATSAARQVAQSAPANRARSIRSPPPSAESPLRAMGIGVLEVPRPVEERDAEPLRRKTRTGCCTKRSRSSRLTGSLRPPAAGARGTAPRARRRARRRGRRRGGPCRSSTAVRPQRPRLVIAGVERLQRMGDHDGVRAAPFGDAHGRSTTSSSSPTGTAGGRRGSTARRARCR